MKNYIYIVFCALVSALICPVSYVFAWASTGHMLTARIAQEFLTPEVRKETERLIDILAPDFYQSRTLVTAAAWPDDLKGEGLPAFNAWHYSNRPYDPHNILTDREKLIIETQLKGTSITWALDEAIKTISNSRSSDWAKAFMLRFLIHLVGDAHQPLHAITLYSPEFPQGDLGGNLFKLNLGLATPVNLHELWDSMGMPEAPIFKRPFDNTTKGMLEMFASMLIAHYPQEVFPEVANLDYNLWLQESFEDAIKFAYAGIEPNSTPSPEYIRQAQRITQQRVVLGGYRLGQLLNKLFDKSSTH